MSKSALIVWGGWEGHTPERSARLVGELLEGHGFDVAIEATTEAFADAALGAFDLIVPAITMSRIEREELTNLLAAVRAGTGIAGFHGLMCDTFRNEPDYQFMTGGQWVAHPGKCIPGYKVRITDTDHPITRGIPDFELKDTEQYYMHVDPGNHVLATTTFTGEHGDATQYRAGTVMPYAWTRQWSQGRVFVAAWGHTHKDFDVPQARELVLRGMLWASR
jgi:type 1 glutamine amidotransferase